MIALSNVSRSKTVDQEVRRDSMRVLDRLVEYTLDKLAYPDGGFVYRKFKGRDLRLNSLRWSQALLCHGLAEYVRLKLES